MQLLHASEWKVLCHPRSQICSTSASQEPETLLADVRAKRKVLLPSAHVRRCIVACKAMDDPLQVARLRFSGLEVLSGAEK